MAVLSTPSHGRFRQRMAGPADFSSELQFRFYPAQSISLRPGQAIFSKSWQMAVLSTPGSMAVLSRQKQPDGHTSRFQQKLAISLLSRTINLSAAGPSYFQAKAGPIAVLSTQGPMAVLTTGGLFSAKACPMAVLSTRCPMAVLSTPGPMAVLSRQRQRMARPPDVSRKLQFRYYPAQSIYQRPDQAVFSKIRPNGRCINGRSNGRFINARPNGRPSGRAKACPMAVLSTRRPMAVLSTPGPMAVLTTGGLFSAKACPMAVLSTRCPMAVLSTPGPMAVLSRQRQRMARPPDVSRKLQFRYYPAQSIYQRPGQVVFSKSRPKVQWPFLSTLGPMVVLSKQATGWPDLQILATNCNFGIIPHNQCNSGRAKLFSSNGRFINAEATGWPDLQISAANCNFAIIPRNPFNSGRAKLFSSKSRPNGRFINARPNGRLSR